MNGRRISTAVSTRLFNPLVRRMIERGAFVRGYALLETTGRRTGAGRRTPVGGRLSDGSFWFVAEHGRRAAYVRNIEADPRVRLQVRGRWRTGTATLVLDDDPLARQRWLRQPLNAWMVRAMGSDLVTVRVELDPELA